MSAAAASPIPVIDLAPFHERSVAGKRAVAAQVDAACRDFGFLQVTGHGVPAPVCDDLLNTWAAFFDLPSAFRLAAGPGTRLGTSRSRPGSGSWPRSCTAGRHLAQHETARGARARSIRHGRGSLRRRR
jgi:isopenicillin N synthase-like dioxygenase